MRSHLKVLFYRGLCPFLLFIRLDKILRINRNHKRLIVMYHGVSRRKNAQINGRHLPVDQFEKQLIYFKNNFNIIPMVDLCEMKRRGIVPEKHTIALTFDDGYLNNLSNALPLLKKYNIPATFFISSVSLDEQDYMHPADLLDIINFRVQDAVEINGRIFKKDRYHLVDVAEKNRSIYQYINSLSLPLWKKTFSDLRLRFPYEQITKDVNAETYKLVTASTLPSLQSESLISIGSHGHWHVNLAMLSEEEINDQLTTSIEILKKHSASPVVCIAFPYGYFKEEVLSIADRLGYQYCIAAGRVDRRYDTRIFPRVGVLNLGSFAFNILSINRSFGRFGF